MKPTVLLIRNAAPNDFGGAEKYPVSLAEIIKKKGWLPIIVSGSEKLLSYSESKGIQTVRGRWLRKQNWSGKRALLFPVYILWQIYLTSWYIYLIGKTNARVVHIQSRDDFIAATLAGRIKRIKVIWTDHMDLRYALENITEPLKNPVGKLVYWAARFSNNIILISNNEHALVTGHFKNKNALSDKIKVITNGVIDQKNIYPEFTSDTFTICLASRIVENKGIGEAIKGFSLFSKNIPGGPVKLQIYGDGEDFDYFKKESGGNPNIEFFGHTDESINAINNSTVYILPSYQEGFSIALLEATMLGKTIVASDVDSNPEIIENLKTGILIPAKNPQAIADALQMLHNNPELRINLGNNARRKYEKEYNLEKIVEEKILPLY